MELCIICIIIDGSPPASLLGFEVLGLSQNKIFSVAIISLNFFFAINALC